MKPEPSLPLQPPAPERGQSLVVIILLGALLAFFGATLTRMLMREASQIVNTKKRDKLFTAGDAALQRSLGVLLANDAAWNSPNNIHGYASLTVVAYTDIPGLRYYIKVMPGQLADQSNTGAATDYHIGQWTNTGDTTRDRTIFVRAVDTTTGREERFYTTVHRTEAPPYTYGGDAIAAEGNVTLGNNWQGEVFDSCLGPYGGSGDLPNTEGSLSMGGALDDPSKVDSGGNWSGFDYNPGSAPGFPALVVPTTVAIPGYTKTSTVSTSFSLSNPTNNTTINYEIADLNMGGSDTITVTGPGKVALWITGASGETMSMGGNNNVIVNPNGSTECCLPKLFTIYVTQVDPNPDNGDRSIGWNGTPAGNFLLVGPKANMEYRGGGSNIFKGAIAVQNLSIAPNSNATFAYDACLKKVPPVNNYSAPPLITTTWRQIGLKTQIIQ